MINLAIVRGRLTRPAEQRVLPSGDRVMSLELSVSRPGERAESVPVSWADPPASAADLDADEQVVVVGRVRRRFFRAGGTTQSRTEVVADSVVRARQTKRAKVVLAAAVEQLEAALSGEG